jgi:hypothetical protein
VTITVIGSVAGAPGATRLAVGLAAAWPIEGTRRVVVEADPDGGRLGAELGVGVEPGLMALALAIRSAPMTPDDLLERGATDVADWFLVAAPPSAEQAHSALVHAASSLADVMRRDPERTAWIVDAGRLSTRSPSLAFARAAAHVVIVTHGSFPHLQLLPHRIEALRSAECQVEVVVVEPTSWSPGEIADFVSADVIGVLPAVRSRRDELATMSTNAWRPWWAAVDNVAAYLANDAPSPSPEDFRVLPDEVVRS